MPRKETLLERPLRKPLDDATRRAIEGEYRKRKHEIPVPTEMRWHATSPQFTIRSPLMSFVVNFTPDERLVVIATSFPWPRGCSPRMPTAKQAVEIHRVDRGRPRTLIRSGPLPLQKPGAPADVGRNEGAGQTKAAPVGPRNRTPPPVSAKTDRVARPPRSISTSGPRIPTRSSIPTRSGSTSF